MAPADHWLLRRSNGRFTIFGPIGVPVLVLTTTGRKTGNRRQIPLTYMREGDRLFLVDSNFGQAHHPAWSSNLLADPNAWVTMGGHEIAVAAAQLTGPEAERVFGKFAYYAHNYDVYRYRTDCAIRVLELTKRERPFR